jgi:DNA-binding MarR family transcriptional regulator
MTAARNTHIQELVSTVSCIYREITAGNCYPFDTCSLSKPQADILFVISEHKEGISVKELAKIINVTSGAITQFINSLVEKNLVERREDTKDRRILQLHLTSQAQEKFRDFKKQYFHAVNPAFDALSDKEIETLIALLRKVTISNWQPSCTNSIEQCSKGGEK